MPNRTPPQHRHVHDGMMRRNMEVRNVVMSIRSAFDSGFINPILHGERSKDGAGGEGLAHDHVSPRRRHTVRTNSDFDTMQVHGTIVAALHVVFASPDELYGSPRRMLRDCRCFTLDVRVRHRSSPEAPA